MKEDSNSRNSSTGHG